MDRRVGPEEDSGVPAPGVPYPAPPPDPARRDPSGGPAGQTFTAYGRRFGVRTSDTAVLEAARPFLPLAWEPIPPGPVDTLYSLYVADLAPAGAPTYHLYADSELLLASADLIPILLALENHATLLTAYQAQDALFVHAGVVGWQGRAILLPGRSMSGKTSLVHALVAAGAVYYSDEYAVLDRQGRVHPYPRALSIRAAAGGSAIRVPVEQIGGQVGTTPLPVGLIVVTAYVPGARWRPAVLTPAAALLALMDNTVAAQREPAHSMPVLREVVLAAPTLRTHRGEAAITARAILRRLG
jgi:hypothetical protein